MKISITIDGSGEDVTTFVQTVLAGLVVVGEDEDEEETEPVTGNKPQLRVVDTPKEEQPQEKSESEGDLSDESGVRPGRVQLRMVREEEEHEPETPAQTEVSPPAQISDLSPDFWDEGQTPAESSEQAPVSAASALQAVRLSEDTLSSWSFASSFRAWSEFVQAWSQGFGAKEPQPDRLALIAGLGSSQHLVTVLRLGYHLGSLQRLVQEGLRYKDDPRSEDLDFCAQVAANITSVSHVGFPDIAGTYDYTNRWRRIAPAPINQLFPRGA